MATNKELHQKVDKILDLSSRLDERQQNMAKDVEGIQLSLVMQNGRIGKLERWRSQMQAISAAGVPIISLAAHWLINKIEGR